MTADPEVLGSLSPSRALTFQQCPRLYRYRHIDKLPEPPSADAARGTLVHAVLEELLALPRPHRTLPRALALLPGAWRVMKAADPALPGQLFPAGDPWATETAFLAEAADRLAVYFQLEDPTRFEPASREQQVEVLLDNGLLLRGIIDRVDIAPTGEVRVVDYKTGKQPIPRYQDKARFQMRFYALVLWKLRGTIPTRLQLIYMGAPSGVLMYSPTEAELADTEADLSDLWAKIRTSEALNDWPTRRQRLCDWCHFKPICPAHTEGAP